MSARLGIVSALASAALFGASTPFAKQLVAGIPPLALAGLLYAASGIALLSGLAVLRIASPAAAAQRARLARGDWPWLVAVIAVGGALGPALLMFGLTRTSATSASLLLNLEAVFTALIAWFVFHENAGARVVAGMALIVAGGVALSWPGGAGPGFDLGALAVAGACLCWGLDNNLTRKLSAGDPLLIAGTKGLAAGAANLALAATAGLPALTPAQIAAAAAVGVLGYGASLVLFMIALRELGAARTGAYFSTAPFIGAAVSIVLLAETAGPLTGVAAALMAAGVWLHLTEHHAHEHTHEPLAHTHAHAHDAHHRHDHPEGWDGAEPHTHYHEHGPLVHSHPHYPDVHHRHRH